MTSGDTVEKTFQPAGAAPKSGHAGIWSCDGQEWRRMIQAAMLWFERHIQAVNALNVFPVPDGDTGTNMYLTLQAAWQEIANSTDASVAPIAQAIAHGALMGARGNSGVILSQLFRGMSQVLERVTEVDPTVFAQSLQQAATTAYKAVIRPVEGTILTVARHAARAGIEAAEGGADLTALLTLVVEATHRAVQETPSQLPVLAEAGVVDAGGQGFFFILQGMERYLRGEAVVSDAPAAEMEMAHAESLEAEYGYDVQYILQGENLDVERIRADILAMGDSVLVVGDSKTIKVHVHTPEPGTPINYGVSKGSLSRVIIENMQEQYQDFVKKSQPAPAQPPHPKAAPAPVAVVAVASGDGLKRVFESLGAAMIVYGGQTMNPSTEDWLKAIEQVDSPEILLLPNNGNVILTAQQAEGLASRRVRVVPTRTIPQGIGALLAFNNQVDVDANAQMMLEAAQLVQTGEVTRAVRSVTLDGLKVEQGQIIGLLNDKLVTANSSIEEVVQVLLREMRAEEMEIITLYYGDGTTEEQAQALADALKAEYPNQEIETVYGGQPHYAYLVSGE